MVAYNLADCLAKIDCPTVCDRVPESCSSDCLNFLRQGLIPLHMAVRGGATRRTIIGEDERQAGIQPNGQTSHKQAQTSHSTKYGSSGVGYPDAVHLNSPPTCPSAVPHIGRDHRLARTSSDVRRKPAEMMVAVRSRLFATWTNLEFDLGSTKLHAKRY
jgi:hypothetical protein